MENKTNSKKSVTHSNRASRLRKQFAASTMSLLAAGPSPSGAQVSKPLVPQVDTPRKPVGDRSHSTIRAKPIAPQHLRSRTLSPNRAPRTLKPGTAEKALTSEEIKAPAGGTTNVKPTPKPLAPKDQVKPELKNKPPAKPKKPVVAKTVAPRGVSVPPQAKKNLGVKPETKPNTKTTALRSHSICTTRPKVQGNELKKSNAAAVKPIWGYGGPAKAKPNPGFKNERDADVKKSKCDQKKPNTLPRFTTVFPKHSKISKEAPAQPKAKVEPTKPEPEPEAEMIRRRRTYITDRSKSQLDKLKGLSPGEEPITLNMDDLNKLELPESKLTWEATPHLDQPGKPQGFNFNFNSSQQEVEGNLNISDITDKSVIANKVSNLFANLKESSSPVEFSANILEVEPKVQTPHFPTKSDISSLTPDEVAKRLYQFFDQSCPETEPKKDKDCSELAGPKPNVEILFENPKQSDIFRQKLQSSRLPKLRALLLNRESVVPFEPKTYPSMQDLENEGECDPKIDDQIETEPREMSNILSNFEEPAKDIDDLPEIEKEKEEFIPLKDMKKDMEFDLKTSDHSDRECVDSETPSNIIYFPERPKQNWYIGSDDEWSNHTTNIADILEVPEDQRKVVSDDEWSNSARSSPKGSTTNIADFPEVPEEQQISLSEDESTKDSTANIDDFPEVPKVCTRILSNAEWSNSARSSTKGSKTNIADFPEVSEDQRKDFSDDESCNSLRSSAKISSINSTDFPEVPEEQRKYASEDEWSNSASSTNVDDFPEVPKIHTRVLSDSELGILVQSSANGSRTNIDDSPEDQGEELSDNGWTNSTRSSAKDSTTNIDDFPCTPEDQGWSSDASSTKDSTTNIDDFPEVPEDQGPSDDELSDVSNGPSICTDQNPALMDPPVEDMELDMELDMEQDMELDRNPSDRYNDKDSVNSRSWGLSSDAPEVPEDERSTCDELSIVSERSNASSDGKLSTNHSSLPDIHPSTTDVAQPLPETNELEAPSLQDQDSPESWGDERIHREYGKLLEEEKHRSYIWRSQLAEIAARTRSVYPEGALDSPPEALHDISIDDFPIGGEKLCEGIQKFMDHIDKRTQQITDFWINSPVIKVMEERRKKWESRQLEIMAKKNDRSLEAKEQVKVPPRKLDIKTLKDTGATAPSSSLCAQPSLPGNASRPLESDSSEEMDINFWKSVEDELTELETGLDDICSKYDKLCSKVQRHSPEFLVTELQKPKNTEQMGGPEGLKDLKESAAKPNDSADPQKDLQPEIETKMEIKPKNSDTTTDPKPSETNWKTASVANMDPLEKEKKDNLETKAAKKPEPSKKPTSSFMSRFECICLRPGIPLECRKCHDFCFGRALKVCKLHPQQEFPSDFNMCPTCHAPSQNLEPSKLSWEDICAFRAATLPPEDEDDF
ncbi:uncharacterized protein LOC6504379 isoform X2 [Drosophila ananassae]|uniref:uncharacterized protein LOC6504379 isoform X2 n=1 Tax=Drosophila ananassae TaxID=7217 RepID=UPI0013A5CA22|nr:uncharacterized protein LOC6504379 isoform X2 [Drosophila ananassae]